jgi:hypothetical protein
VPSPNSENKAEGEGEGKQPEIDWAEVYADLLCHTSISIFEIPEMTLPQINAIRSRIGKHIPLSMGMPGLFGGTLEKPIQENDGKPPKLSEFMAFASAFDAIK